MANPACLIVDACVLIDFLVLGDDLLRQYCARIAPLHVPRTLLAEVDGLDDARCHRLGLVIVDELAEDLRRAAVERPGLSFEDCVLLLVATRQRWTCVTNDLTLRSACGEAGLAVRWGLELLLDLVRERHLRPEDARAHVRAIQRENPFITAKLVARFDQRLREL